MDSEEWWNKVMVEIYLAAGANERELKKTSLAMTGEAFQLFTSKEGWELYPEIPGILGRLRDRELMLGVISNNDERVGKDYHLSFILSLVLLLYQMVKLCSPSENLGEPGNWKVFQVRADIPGGGEGEARPRVILGSTSIGRNR